MPKTYAHCNRDGDAIDGFATKEEAIAAAEERVAVEGDDATAYTIYELDENDIITAAWDDGFAEDGSKVGQPFYNV